METFGQAHLCSAIVTRVTFLRPTSRFGGPDAHLLPLSNTFISETCGYIFENGHIEAGKEDIIEWVLDGAGGRSLWADVCFEPDRRKERKLPFREPYRCQTLFQGPLTTIISLSISTAPAVAVRYSAIFWP